MCLTQQVYRLLNLSYKFNRNEHNLHIIIVSQYIFKLKSWVLDYYEQKMHISINYSSTTHCNRLLVIY